MAKRVRKILPPYFMERNPESAHTEFEQPHRHVISAALRAFKRTFRSGASDGKILDQLQNFAYGFGFSDADKAILKARLDSYKQFPKCPIDEDDKEKNPVAVKSSAIWRFSGGAGGRSPASNLNEATCSVIRDFLIWHGLLSPDQLFVGSGHLGLASSLAAAFGATRGSTFPDDHSNYGTYSYFFCSIDDEDAMLIIIKFYIHAPSVYDVTVERKSFDSACPPEVPDQAVFDRVDRSEHNGWLLSYGRIRFGAIPILWGEEDLYPYSMAMNESTHLILHFERRNSGESLLINENQEYVPVELEPISNYDKSKLFDDYKIIHLGGLRYSETVVKEILNKKEKELLGKELLEIMIEDGQSNIFLTGPKEHGDRIRAATALVQRGAPMTSPADENGWTALHFAMRGSYTPILNAAIERGADDPDIDFLAEAKGHLGRKVRPFQVLDHCNMDAQSEEFTYVLYDLAKVQGARRGLTLNEINLLPPHAPPIEDPDYDGPSDPRLQDESGYDEPDTMDGP